ncbi:nuclear transport factor 2 family protein [Corallococcus sp. AS-1-6]|uniref:nuclear transport factor 2 family protein n=1 Tax=Corallococcus sp. AS-1-6 TaxID=2874599 RepID=UPI001CBE8E87|nr:nuclear transport factor 2 family protein [Corallococcus sp. AS-1-6]MBZ4371035.1 nuclear transport factor 2 family protein [Corallococcus sp. AS-1-6]
MPKTLSLVTLALLTACAHSAPLPSPGPFSRLHASPEEAVQAYFQASDTGSSRLLRTAFHPDVVMHWVDGTEGALRTRTQLEWWQRLDADAQAPQPATRRGMTVLDREGPFALMEAVSHWPDRTYDDLLLVVETPVGWRIVGKVFQRLAPGERATGSASAREEVRAVLDAKIEAHARYSHALLYQSHTPDCLYYRVNVEGVPFAWGTLSEAAARYAANAEAGVQDRESPWNVLKVEVRGNVAAAKLEVRVGGVRFIDHLLLVRTGGQWRISAAAWGNPVPPP